MRRCCGAWLAAALAMMAAAAASAAEPPCRAAVPAGTTAASGAAPAFSNRTTATRLLLPTGLARAAWEEQGAPVVVIVPDHLGLDARAEFHSEALCGKGLAALLLDLPPSPDAGGEHGWRLREPTASSGIAETLLPLLFEVLEALAAERPPGARDSRLRAVGLLGFGTGGEAAALAAHDGVAEAFGQGYGGPRFRAYVAIYPTCVGSALASLRRENARTTGAPVLLVLAHPGGPDEDPGGCGRLFDWTDRSHPDPFTVRTFWWMPYGFDFWPAAAAQAFRLHHFFPGGMAPDRFDALSAEAARREIAAFLLRALTSGPAESAIASARPGRRGGAGPRAP